MTRLERTLLLALALCALALASADAHIPTYTRSAWTHWIDVDRDCQNTRDEVLIKASIEPVLFADARRCRVVSGRWRDVYSGAEYTDPRELDVDHVVPLAFAHAHGGWTWSSPIKTAYANDLDEPLHLLVVHRSLNRAKGSKGPDAWLPPDAAAHCVYGRAWRAITERWGLALQWHEVLAIERLVERCS